MSLEQKDRYRSIFGNNFVIIKSKRQWLPNVGWRNTPGVKSLARAMSVMAVGARRAIRYSGPASALAVPFVVLASGPDLEDKMDHVRLAFRDLRLTPVWDLQRGPMILAANLAITDAFLELGASETFARILCLATFYKIYGSDADYTPDEDRDLGVIE